MSTNPGVDTRRVRRLESQLSSLSSENDKAVQNLEKAVAELTLRVANLESQAGGPAGKSDTPKTEL